MQEELPVLYIFFLLRSDFAPTETSSASFPYPHSSCRALFPPLVIWTCVRTFVRVHYKHVHRRGVSRLNIDMLLKLNRIDGKNDDVPHSAPPFLPACFVRRRRYWCHLDAQSRVRRCVFAQAYRVFFLVSPRGPSALATGKSNPKARQTMRSPSEAPAATQPVCGNIYTEVACTRPSLRPCIPLRGSQSPPRFLKIHRKIGSIECSHISYQYESPLLSFAETIVLKIIFQDRWPIVPTSW